MDALLRNRAALRVELAGGAAVLRLGGLRRALGELAALRLALLRGGGLGLLAGRRGLGCGLALLHRGGLTRIHRHLLVAAAEANAGEPAQEAHRTALLLVVVVGGLARRRDRGAHLALNHRGNSSMVGMRWRGMAAGRSAWGGM